MTAMTTKQIAGLLTQEEKVLVQTANNVQSNVTYKLLEKLAQERAKVYDLEQKLKRRNGNG